MEFRILIIDIKLAELRWAGHVQRMNSNEMAKKTWKINQWEEEMLEDSDLDRWCAGAH